VFADVNNDGKPDLIVANDSCPNYLYLNKGDGTFEDVSYASGYALNEKWPRDGVDGHRRRGLSQQRVPRSLQTPAFPMTTIRSNRNDGEANFDEVSYRAGLAEVTIPFLAWGTTFLDYDMMAGRISLSLTDTFYPGVDDSGLWGTTFCAAAIAFPTT